MSQLWQQQERLDELNLAVKIVTFDEDFLALAYIKSVEMTWPLLLDPEQELFEAYGMKHGSWWSIYGLPSIAKYLALIFRGRMPGRPGKDWRQLGGDVLIDPDGVVRVHYISTGPHDRPSVEDLITAVEQGNNVTEGES